MTPLKIRFGSAICQSGKLPLSPPLTLNGSASSAQIRAYLGDLLPENSGLDHLIEALSVSRSNLFALIHGIGRDVSGAVTFTLPTEQDVPTRFRPITPEELLLRLDQPEIWPLEIWDGRPRLSVAGGAGQAQRAAARRIPGIWRG